MYRLLIVDDEPIIADGLYEIISRVDELQLDIYKTYSSLEALELMQKIRFDIVLTDIQMPGMNGLELAEQLRTTWPKCRIVFLTGYHDFDYVYQAIQHERVSYILKTEGYDKIIETIKFALEDTAQHVKSEEMQQFVIEQQSRLLHTSRQQFFCDLLKERIPVQEVSALSFQELQIPLRANEDILLLLGKFKRNRMLGYTERAQLTYQMEWLANFYFQDFKLNKAVVIDEPLMIWMIQPCFDEGERTQQWQSLQASLQGHLDQLQEAFSAEVDVEISLVLDHQHVGWSSLAERYEQLNLLFQYRVGAQDARLITSTDMVNCEQKQLMHKSTINAFKYEQLQVYLQNGQQEEFFQLFTEIRQFFLQAASDNIAEELYLSVAMLYFSYINRWNMLEQVSAQMRFQRLLRLKEHDSREEAISYLHECGKLLFTLQNQVEEERATIVIEKVQKYILEHLHDPNKLSLVHLAETVFFNASYLSRLFKQVTNINLSDFIVNARMERAKQLLAQPELKIQDIAERVGYSNATNFTRVFRKLTGCTPQDYRVTMIGSQ